MIPLRRSTRSSTFAAPAGCLEIFVHAFVADLGYGALDVQMSLIVKARSASFNNSPRGTPSQRLSRRVVAATPWPVGSDGEPASNRSCRMRSFDDLLCQLLSSKQTFRPQWTHQGDEPCGPQVWPFGEDGSSAGTRASSQTAADLLAREMHTAVRLSAKSRRSRRIRGSRRQLFRARTDRSRVAQHLSRGSSIARSAHRHPRHQNTDVDRYDRTRVRKETVDQCPHPELLGRRTTRPRKQGNEPGPAPPVPSSSALGSVRSALRDDLDITIRRVFHDPTRYAV